MENSNVLVDQVINPGDQFVRSVDSVGANISEGYSRFHYLDRIRFYYIARASLSEACDHWLDLLLEREKIQTEKFNMIQVLGKKLQIKLNNFIASTYRNKKETKRSRPIYFYIFLFISICFISVDLRGQNPLDNYLRIAADNNPGLKAKFQNYQAALERLPQAKALPDPELTFGYFVMPVETRIGAQEATVGISQSFPWFGQLKAQEQVEAHIAESRFQVFEEAKFKLFFDIKVSYTNLYVLNAIIDITRENIELLRTFKELANVKFESGNGSFVNVLRIEMQIRELESQIDFLEDSKIPLHTQFKELLNVPLPESIEFPDTLWKEKLLLSKEAIYDSILLGNPTLKEFDFQIQSVEKQVDVAQKMGKPSFKVGLNYINVSERSGVSISDNGNDALVLPQIGVKIPLYRNKYRAMVKEKQIQQESIEFAKENASNALITELEKGFRDYLDAERRLFLYKGLSGLANQSLDILVAEYSSAGRDFEEVLEMDQQFLKYALELEKARGDQNTAIAYLNYLMGK